ncbi:MAG: putative porin [Rikenellaceae bacterium]
MQFTLSKLLRALLPMITLLVVSTGSVWAQSGPEGGNAGEGGAGGGKPKGEGEDTTQVAKIKLPLESYFFSDSMRAVSHMSWTINRDYNEIEFQPLDTTLTNWRIDYPVHKDGVGDMMLGGLGQASQAIDYSDRNRDFNFTFARPYSSYVYTMENAPFYNNKSIFTQLNYIEAGQTSYREANFEIRHAQNVSPSTAFNINYKSPGTKGQYMRQDTKNHNLSIAGSHTGKRYTVHAGYINNKIVTEESGGVVGKWAITDSLFEMNIGIPMKLENAEAQNIYRNTSIYVEQSYGLPLEPMGERDFSMADLSAIYFGHSFEYNAWSKTYSDVYATYTNALSYRDEDGNYVSEEGEYYDNWYINPTQTRDTLSERVVSNRLFFQAQPWGRDGVLGTLNGGVGFDFHTYSQFSKGDYLTGELERDHKTSWFVYGKIDGKVREYVDWGANLKIYPSGYRGGDMSAGAHITLAANVAQKALILKGELNVERQSPSYWEENLFSNHFVWSNNFDTQSESRFKVSLMVPDYNLEVAFTQNVVTDKIYYNSQSIVSQASGAVSVTSLYAQKNFKIGGLNLDHRILWQVSTDQSVIAVPTLSAYISYYYDFWVVKDVLQLQTGIDCRYTTMYYMPGYNPALSTFYNQRESESGGYPYMDAYVAGKWKRMRILLKYQHLNDGLFGNRENFAVSMYPLNPGMLKFGISWCFYD